MFEIDFIAYNIYMFKKIEKVLSIIVLLGVLCLAAHNISLNVQNVKFTSNTSGNDVFYTQSYYYKEPYELRLSINSLGSCDILINGQVADTSFSNEGYAVITVYDKDVVSLDLRNCEGEVSVFVAETSENILLPKVGTKMFVTGGIKELFTVETVMQN